MLHCFECQKFLSLFVNEEFDTLIPITQNFHELDLHVGHHVISISNTLADASTSCTLNVSKYMYI